jgi:hypothetical protein
MTEKECFKPLHAVAEDLAAKGASPGSIAAALVDVALKIAERDRAYAAVDLGIVGTLLSAGADLACMLQMDRLKSREQK